MEIRVENIKNEEYNLYKILKDFKINFFLHYLVKKFMYCINNICAKKVTSECWC